MMQQCLHRKERIMKTQGKSTLSRRDFFQLIGLGAGAAAVNSVSHPMSITALANAPSNGGKLFKRPWWVRTVDKPTVGATNSDFQRFSGANIGALYKNLKDKAEGEGAYDTQQALKNQHIAQWIKEEKPGFTLRDRTLYDGSWTINRASQPGEGIYSWTLIGNVTPPQKLGLEPYTASPEEMANTIKTVARLYGAALAGIAPMNEKYVYLKQSGKDVVFKDVDVPEVNDTEMVIPKKMKWVVSVAVQMDHDLFLRAPTALGDAGASLGYSTLGFLVSMLAEYIRGLGYQAIPMVNDTAASIPFAIDAGLGEMSRLNRMITPEFGPMVRLAKVFTDMPMAYDKPIDFGAARFCRVCKKCAQACPSGTLSFDTDPSFKTQGPWNNPGHETWYENSYNCYSYWQDITTGCGICFNACPFNKADKAWVHQLVRATISEAPFADALMRQMDDAFGYGTEDNPDDWWTYENWPAFGVDSVRSTRS
jgi:epoxyqueuosine reductase